MLEIASHCRCGDSLTGRVSDPLLADVLIMEFSASHQKPGCEPCKPPKAEKQRRCIHRPRNTTEDRDVLLLAVSGKVAMVRRLGCMAYVCPVSELETLKEGANE